jgi:hypothetical protein
MGTPAGPTGFQTLSGFPTCPLSRVFGRVGAAGWLVHLPKNRFSEPPLRKLLLLTRRPTWKHRQKPNPFDTLQPKKSIPLDRLLFPVAVPLR